MTLKCFSMYQRKWQKEQYSEVPNKIFTRLFIFGKSSQLHCFFRNKYKKISNLQPLIKTYMFNNFWENLPPTWLLEPHAY